MSRQGGRVGKACRKATYSKVGKASTQEKGNTGRHGMQGGQGRQADWQGNAGWHAGQGSSLGRACWQVGLGRTRCGSEVGSARQATIKQEVDELAHKYGKKAGRHGTAVRQAGNCRQ